MPYATPVTLPLNMKVSRLVGGNSHYCVLGDLGELTDQVYCWGQGDEGLFQPACPVLLGQNSCEILRTTTRKFLGSSIILSYLLTSGKYL